MTGPPSPVDRVVGTGQPLGHGRLAANTWYAVDGERKEAAAGTSVVADVNSVKLTNTLRRKFGPAEQRTCRSPKPRRRRATTSLWPSHRRCSATPLSCVEPVVLPAVPAVTGPGLRASRGRVRVGIPDAD